MKFIKALSAAAVLGLAVAPTANAQVVIAGGGAGGAGAAGAGLLGGLGATGLTVLAVVGATAVIAVVSSQDGDAALSTTSTN